MTSEEKLNTILSDKKLSWNYFGTKASQSICFWYTIFYIYLFIKYFGLHRLIVNSFISVLLQFIFYWIFLCIFCICYGILYTFIFIQLAKIQTATLRRFSDDVGISNLQTIVILAFFIITNLYRMSSVYLIYFLTKLLYVYLFVVR